MTQSWILLGVLCAPLAAQPLDAGFFESKIRPVLATKCYACHSSSLKSPMGGPVLDTKSGVLKGGATGPVVVAGKPTESRLLKALRYTDPHLQMPPTGKLSDPVIADFDRWIAAGAPDPRTETASGSKTAAPLKGMSIEDAQGLVAVAGVGNAEATLRAVTPHERQATSRNSSAAYPDCAQPAIVNFAPCPLT